MRAAPIRAAKDRGDRPQVVPAGNPAVGSCRGGAGARQDPRTRGGAGMPTAVQVAAVIAAAAFAVLAAAGVYALVKLARLISAASAVVAEFRVRSDLVLGRADAAVDRAHEQLARTDAITANMDEVSSSIAELTADVSMLTGAVRTLLGGPLRRLAAVSFGVRP